MGEGFPSKCEHMQAEGREIMSLRMFDAIYFFLGKYLLNKLLAIITCFASKICFLRNYIPFFVWFMINPY